MRVIRSVSATELPSDSIAKPYADQGRYVDCFSVTVDAKLSFNRYLVGFYTSRVFKLERLVLKYVVSKPSTDQQALELASGQRDTFAAWSQEARSDRQIIMCDYQQLTRSWLMLEPDGESTTLYFGTIIVPKGRAETRGDQMGLIFKLTLWGHLLYSCILLRSAVSNLRRLMRQSAGG